MKKSKKFKLNGLPEGEGFIRVGHINLNGLTTFDSVSGKPDKFDNLRIILNNSEFDVFVVGESRVKGILEDELLRIYGYTMVRLDRDYDTTYVGKGNDAGGLLVYVRKGLTYKMEKRNVVTENHVFQYIDIELEDKQRLINVIGVYNPPGNGNLVPMKELLEKQKKPCTIILGDININIDGKINQQYQNSFRKLKYKQLVTKNTRPKSKTLIDHIYTNNSDMIGESGVQHQEGFADHSIIYCAVKIASL